MTCVVGLEDKKSERVIIYADSMYSNESEHMISALPKVFKLPTIKAIIGFAGDARSAQIMQYAMKIPTRVDHLSAEAYLIGHFIPAFKNALVDGAVAMKSYDADFLVGLDKKLFTIDSDFQLNRFVMNDQCYCAIGTGSTYALGAMHHLTQTTLDPETVLIKALQASEAFCQKVKGPWNGLSLEPTQIDIKKVSMSDKKKL